MRLFLFHDDIEEILVSAESKDDAFQVIEEVWGSEAADALIMSSLKELDIEAKSPRGIIGHTEPGGYTR